TGTRAMMSKLPKWMWMDAQTVVEQGLAAVERGDAVYINGAVNRAIKTAFKLMPDRLALTLIGRKSRQFRKQTP
ncbi:MAG: dehydrogenase, partial [Dokdonella sp.]